MYEKFQICEISSGRFVAYEASIHPWGNVWRRWHSGDIHHTQAKAMQCKAFQCNAIQGNADIYYTTHKLVLLWAVYNDALTSAGDILATSITRKPRQCNAMQCISMQGISMQCNVKHNATQNIARHYYSDRLIQIRSVSFNSQCLKFCNMHMHMHKKGIQCKMQC